MEKGIALEKHFRPIVELLKQIVSNTLSARNPMWNRVRMKHSFWEKKSQNPNKNDQTRRLTIL